MTALIRAQQTDKPKQKQWNEWNGMVVELYTNVTRLYSIQMSDLSSKAFVLMYIACLLPTHTHRHTQLCRCAFREQSRFIVDIEA